MKLQVHLVDQPGLQILAHGRDAATDPHVLALGGLARAVQRHVDALRHEVNVVPSSITSGARGWCVSTNNGT